ncbi:MAG: hypothetical protein QOH88_3449 [Verrucomicrobiota bacterium]|jgi:hypothetical protein
MIKNLPTLRPALLKILSWLLYPFRRIPPILAALVCCPLSVLSFVAATHLNGLPSALMPFFVVVLLGVLALPFVPIALALFQFRRLHRNFSGVIGLFFANIICWSNIHLIINALPEAVGIHDRRVRPYSNMIDPWVWKYDHREIDFERFRLSVVDAFHYSVVTSCTVGYGDCSPTTPQTKVATDIQILVSFAISVFSIGYALSAFAASQPVKTNIYKIRGQSTELAAQRTPNASGKGDLRPPRDP